MVVVDVVVVVLVVIGLVVVVVGIVVVVEVDVVVVVTFGDATPDTHSIWLISAPLYSSPATYGSEWNVITASCELQLSTALHEPL